MEKIEKLLLFNGIFHVTLSSGIYNVILGEGVYSVGNTLEEAVDAINFDNIATNKASDLRDKATLIESKISK